MRVLILIFSSLSLAWACTNCHNRITLKSPQPHPNWGDWHHMEHCPNGMYANGMQIKYESWQGTAWDSNDDTALNAVRLYCNDLNASVCNTNRPIASGIGDRGTWRDVLWCPPGQVIIGFALRVFPWKSQTDDVAADNFSAACGKPFGPRVISTWIQSKTYDWGAWNPNLICPAEYVVCGIQTQIYHKYDHDRVGLNNVNVDCCKITDIQCTPGYEFSTLASYDNSQGSQKASISYNVKTSFKIEGSGRQAAQTEKDIISKKILNSADYLATSINVAINRKKDHITGSDLRSMVQGAMLHESQASVTIEIPKKQKAVVKQLYLTCGSYRISLPKTIEEGTKKPKNEDNRRTKKPKYSHEHDNHHEDSDDDC